MPTYEYRCESCQHQFEVFAKMSDPAPTACEECGGTELTKVLFPVNVHYKGSGFYATDYAGKGKAPASSSSSSQGGEAGGGSSGDAGGASSSTSDTPSSSSGGSDAGSSGSSSASGGSSGGSAGSSSSGD